MKKKTFILVLILFAFSCKNNDNTNMRLYKSFKSFLNNKFNITSLELNNKYIIINSKGCRSCVVKEFEYYSDSVLTHNNYYFVISNTAYKGILKSPKINPRMLIDKDDEIEYGELSIYGVSILFVDKEGEILKKDINISCPSDTSSIK